MATNTTNATAKSNLLDPSQQTICTSVAKGEAPHKQRASALLAVDSGKTMQQAAEENGLTLGQVRYWVGRFRKLGVDIFPADRVAKPTGQASAEENIEKKPAVEASGDKEDRKSEKAKETKSEAKATKTKDKKGKKDKKDKKNKVKTKKNKVKTKKNKVKTKKKKSEKVKNKKDKEQKKGKKKKKK
jgi:hypothetical protein